MLPNSFVIIWDGKPIGLDTASGGYPFKTSYPGSVKYWETRESAQKYADMFPESNWAIEEIQFRIVNS